MRCKHVRERLSLYLVGELAPADRSAMAEHLASCPACAEELAETRRLLGVVEEALARVPTPAALERRIMSAVAVTPLPRRVRRSKVPPVPVAEDEEERDFRRRSTAQLVLAAAVVLLLVVIWQVTPQREGTPPADKASEQAGARSRPTVETVLAAAPPVQPVTLSALGGARYRVLVNLTDDTKWGTDTMPAERRARAQMRATTREMPRAVGEAAMPGPPADHTFNATLPEALDLLGKTRDLSAVSAAPDLLRRRVQITLRNPRRDRDIQVEVVQRVGEAGQIENSTHQWTRTDANTVTFLVPVKRSGEATLVYILQTPR